MNPLKVQLKALAEFLSEQEIKYIVLGGIAVSVYGEPRLTADIDVNILLDKKRVGDFLAKAKAYGFYPNSHNLDNFIEKAGVIPMLFKKRDVVGKINFIIAENALECAAIERGKVKEIDSIKLRLISPEDLVIHKITSLRSRDLEDVNSIIIRQKSKLDIGYIRNWLNKIDKIGGKGQFLKLFQEFLSRI